MLEHKTTCYSNDMLDMLHYSMWSWKLQVGAYHPDLTRTRQHARHMALPGPPANAYPCHPCRAERVDFFEGVPLRLKKTEKEGASKYINVKIVKNKDGTTMFQAFYTDKDGNKKSIGTFMDERRAAKAACMFDAGVFDEEHVRWHVR